MSSGNGIARLIEVCGMKANAANDEALQGADKQRDLIAKQKTARDAKRNLDDAAADGELTPEEYNKMVSYHSSMFAAGMSQTSANAYPGIWYANADKDENGNIHYKIGDENEWQKKNKATIERLSKAYEDFSADLDAKDKLGNMEIQDLMARYNEMNTLASSVRKKDEDSNSAVIGKI